MNDFEKITQDILNFRDKRNWSQFHTGKDLAICLNVETSELLELFLWKGEVDVSLDRIKEELADVFYSAILLAHHYDLNIMEMIEDKLHKNEDKYPVDKAKDSNKKYNEL